MLEMVPGHGTHRCADVPIHFQTVCGIALKPKAIYVQNIRDSM